MRKGRSRRRNNNSNNNNNNNNSNSQSSSDSNDPSTTTPTKLYTATGTASTPTVSTPMPLRGSNTNNSNKGASTNAGSGGTGYGYNTSSIHDHGNGMNGMNGMNGGTNTGNGYHVNGYGNGNNGNGNGSMMMAAKKPISQEVANLTAKNYRLAKELNDLRLRHKDETKTVTRLTMENMNLASRCRQAIIHADALKKELELHRKKTAELMHRQTTRKNGYNNINNNISKSYVPQDNGDISPLSTNTMDVVKSSREMITLDNENKFNTNKKVNRAVIVSQIRTSIGSDYNINPTMDMANNYKYKDNHNKNKNTNDSSDTFRGNSPLANEEKAIADKSSTGTTLRTSMANDIEDKSHVAFGELQSTDFFTGAYENTLPATPEKENDDVLSMTDSFQQFNMMDNGIKETGSNEENSYDAFEASFETTFPSSFSLTASEAATFSLEEVFNDSNSFFADLTTNTSKEKQSEKLREQSSPSSPRMNSSKSNKSRISKDLGSTSPSSSSSSSLSPSNPATSSNEDLALFPSAFDCNTPPTTESSTSTPPSKGKFSDQDGSNLQPPSPPSEKQSGGAAARARYKYALTDTDENVAPMDEADADKSETSPTLVLQRLHQRKVREKSSGASLSPNDETNGSVRSPITSEEMQELDALANGPHGRAIKSNVRRRAVKQPVSYAEPSLSSKLRRGDVFFAKTDVENEAESKTVVNA